MGHAYSWKSDFFFLKHVLYPPLTVALLSVMSHDVGILCDT